MLSLASFALVLALVLGAGAYAVARIDALDSRALLVVAAVGIAVGGATAQVAPVAPAEPTVTGTTASDRAPESADLDADGVAGERHGTTDTIAAATESASSPANATTVTVVGVSGGDWVTYRTESGDRRTVRLAGLDVPDAGGADPARFEGVLTGSRGRTCLAEQGRRALIDARGTLVGETVTVQSVDGGAGATTAVLTRGGRSINRRFVERGDARATDGRYADAERAARSADRGVWACSTVEPTPPRRESSEPGIRIAAVHPNPPGDDAAALTDEYVILENAGEVTVDLSNWYLVDGDGETYFFFDGRTLRPGEELVVHVGTGRDTDGHVYWGASSPVLDNDHETLKLVDGDSERTVRLSY
jgi:endonuclease YncB( thermonuclease family)